MTGAIGIAGGGAWGTALALVAVRAGRRATIWARDAATVAALNDARENPRYLPGIPIDPAVSATGDIAAAAAADVVVLAVPAQTVRAVALALAPHLAPGTPVVVAAKGLERGTDKRMSEVVTDAVPQAMPAVLSGPSFAADVARGLPTAVTIATHDERLALDLCRVFGSPTFRPYAETDMIGVEIGGAVKNVLAIAAGIVSGKHLGASALAALIARSFAELRRLGQTLGARSDTLMGLSGLGDLVLTCSGPQSRNFSYGALIGAGGDRSAPHPLVEGIATAAVARDLARHHAILMPIVEAVAAILDEALTVEAAIDSLMTRPLKREAD
jgi:glycerol-3-phosphate dehydrogenase (NAD(P)+)